ncbi:MAG: hypothetical protein J5732_06675 [Bacteroidaceae bacterium]|nr:hypothetical protein [Bacteroidaceae bacterium]
MAYYNVLSSKRFANFAVYLGDDGVRKYQTYDRIAEVCLIVKAVKLTIQAFKDALQATFDMQMTTFTENTYPILAGGCTWKPESKNPYK